MKKILTLLILVIFTSLVRAQQPSIAKTAFYDEVVSEFAPGILLVKSKLNYGLVDKRTNKIILPIQYVSVWPPTDGMAIVIFETEGKQLRGFIDENYTLAITPKYKCAKPFTEGLAAVCIDNIWGYIDKKGIVKIALKYRMALPFKDGVAEVMDEKNEVFKINIKGERL